jgi:hypothetical protein
VQTLHVQDNLIGQISRSLQSGDGEPSLELLHNLKELVYSGGSNARDAFIPFINERQAAGHPVSLTDHSLLLFWKPWSQCVEKMKVFFVYSSPKLNRTLVLVDEPIWYTCVRSFVDPVPTEDLPPCRLTSKWPGSLLLEPAWHTMLSMDFQKWLRMHRPGLVMLKPASETVKDNYDFKQLFYWLKDNKWVGSPVLSTDYPLMH